MFYLELVGGLRKGELLAPRWDNADIQNRTISVSKQHVLDPDGSQELTRPKTENLMRLLSIPQTAVDLLTQEHNKHPDCPTCSPPRLPGKCTPPYSVVNLHKKLLKDAGRFHDLRHSFAITALQNGVDVKQCSPCWATMMPSLPFAPTPTPHSRSRMRQQSQWAASWHRSRKAQKKRTGQENRCAYILPCEPSASGSGGTSSLSLALPYEAKRGIGNLCRRGSRCGSTN